MIALALVIEAACTPGATRTASSKRLTAAWNREGWRAPGPLMRHSLRGLLLWRWRRATLGNSTSAFQRIRPGGMCHPFLRGGAQARGLPRARGGAAGWRRPSLLASLRRRLPPTADAWALAMPLLPPHGVMRRCDCHASQVARHAPHSSRCSGPSREPATVAVILARSSGPSWGPLDVGRQGCLQSGCLTSTRAPFPVC